jgi:hypothetical protein
MILFELEVSNVKFKEPKYVLTSDSITEAFFEINVITFICFEGYSDKNVIRFSFISIYYYPLSPIFILRRSIV